MLLSDVPYHCSVTIVLESSFSLEDSSAGGISGSAGSIFNTSEDDSYSASRLAMKTPIIIQSYVTEWIVHYLFLVLEYEVNINAIIATIYDILCIIQHKLVDITCRRNACGEVLKKLLKLIETIPDTNNNLYNSNDILKLIAWCLLTIRYLVPYSEEKEKEYIYQYYVRILNILLNQEIITQDAIAHIRLLSELAMLVLQHDLLYTNSTTTNTNATDSDSQLLLIDYLIKHCIDPLKTKKTSHHNTHINNFISVFTHVYSKIIHKIVTTLTLLSSYMSNKVLSINQEEELLLLNKHQHIDVESFYLSSNNGSIVNRDNHPWCILKDNDCFTIINHTIALISEILLLQYNNKQATMNNRNTNSNEDDMIEMISKIETTNDLIDMMSDDDNDIDITTSNSSGSKYNLESDCVKYYSKLLSFLFKLLESANVLTFNLSRY